MSSVDSFLRVKAEVEETKEQLEQSKGKLELLMGELKKSFGCSTVEEAEALLRKYKKQEERLTKEFDGLYQEFKEKWDDRLSE